MTLFGASPAVVGMIHAAALPGSPQASLTIREIAAQARREARVYRNCGFHALLVENMRDRPYLKRAAGPEIVACMTRLAWEIREETGLPCGAQILAGANAEALAVALAAELDFIRVEGFVFAHVADEGLIEGQAGELLRLRRSWGANRVKIWADVKKKHASHAMTADLDLAETARAAEFFLADAVIVTGTRTGDPASQTDLTQVRGATHLPVLAGSGVTADNVRDYASLADGLIVGSACKADGRWEAPVDEARARALMEALGVEISNR